MPSALKGGRELVGPGYVLAHDDCSELDVVLKVALQGIACVSVNDYPITIS